MTEEQKQKLLEALRKMCTEDQDFYGDYSEWARGVRHGIESAYDKFRYYLEHEEK